MRAIGLRRQEVALILITMLWGTTFLIIQHAMHHSGPLFFTGMRFLSAAVILSIICYKSLKGLTLRELWGGILIGLTIFLANSLQSAGLKTISSSQSAFITAVYVPMVPLLQWVFFRKMPGLLSWIGAAFAFVGLLFISGNQSGTLSFSQGEIFTLFCALAVAAEIILIGLFSHGVDSRRVTIVQLWAASLIAFGSMPALGESVPAFNPNWVFAALALGSMSAIIQFTMNWAQKSVSPTKATVIYAAEPVWAGIAGRIAGERMAPYALVGAALIFSGIIISELKLKWFQKKTTFKYYNDQQ